MSDLKEMLEECEEGMSIDSAIEQIEGASLACEESGFKLKTSQNVMTRAVREKLEEIIDSLLTFTPILTRQIEKTRRYNKKLLASKIMKVGCYAFLLYMKGEVEETSVKVPKEDVKYKKRLLRKPKRIITTVNQEVPARRYVIEIFSIGKRSSKTCEVVNPYEHYEQRVGSCNEKVQSYWQGAYREGANLLSQGFRGFNPNEHCGHRVSRTTVTILTYGDLEDVKVSFEDLKGSGGRYIIKPTLLSKVVNRVTESYFKAIEYEMNLFEQKWFRVPSTEKRDIQDITLLPYILTSIPELTVNASKNLQQIIVKKNERCLTATKDIEGLEVPDIKDLK